MQGVGGIRDIEARLKDFGVIQPWSNSETTDAASPLVHRGASTAGIGHHHPCRAGGEPAVAQRGEAALDSILHDRPDQRRADHGGSLSV